MPARIAIANRLITSSARGPSTWTPRIRPDDFDQHFEAGMRLADTSGGVPRSDVALVNIEGQVATLRDTFEEPHGRERWDREHHARNHRVIW
jgi:hypothetical protein